MEHFSKEQDLDIERGFEEKHAGTTYTSGDETNSDYVGDEGAVPAETFVMGDGLYAKVRPSRQQNVFVLASRGLTHPRSIASLAGLVLSREESSVCPAMSAQTMA